MVMWQAAATHKYPQFTELYLELELNKKLHDQLMAKASGESDCRNRGRHKGAGHDGAASRLRVEVHKLTGIVPRVGAQRGAPHNHLMMEEAAKQTAAEVAAAREQDML
jgi:hypothetical protein